MGFCAYCTMMNKTERKWFYWHFSHGCKNYVIAWEWNCVCVPFKVKGKQFWKWRAVFRFQDTAYAHTNHSCHSTLVTHHTAKTISSASWKVRGITASLHPQSITVTLEPHCWQACAQSYLLNSIPMILIIDDIGLKWKPWISGGH